jgi:hypothetical protein
MTLIFDLSEEYKKLFYPKNFKKSLTKNRLRSSNEFFTKI